MKLSLLLLLAGLAATSAMCPNGCSGHGICSEFDMCTCYQNWQGNDCSEQTCPFEVAFATTPQGDLNMDGDRYDNTQKLLVKVDGGLSNQGTMMENDDILTLNKAINTNELIVGDAIRVGDETFVVTAVDAGLKFTLDHDRFTGITTEVNVYKYLENIQSPKGTWESWAGDFNADDDEGHYYMECSNRGLCDRKTGTCECFDGYAGASCQRQQCPNDCSGHGTCATVTELASTSAPQLTTFTVHTATAGSSTITPSADPTSSLLVGDTIRLGTKAGQNLQITAISATAITVYPTSALSHEFGSLMYFVPKYDLWDGNKDRSCTCDSPYTGGDCSLRACPTGDDPLTVFTMPTSVTVDGATAYQQHNEKQNIYLNTQRGALSGTFTLTFTDAFGQKWTTEKIYVNERLSSKAYVDATTRTTVTFSPSLPYGELEAGDFLMIGDERQEVLATYPIVSNTQHRPIKLGGVVDSVMVANVFAVSSTNVYCFRAGPAKGIKAALEALPNSVVPSVTSEAFNTGTLIGHHLGGVATTAAGMTTIKSVLGSFDQQGAAGAASAGRTSATLSTGGGLAPYDTIRVVAVGGKSQFMQLRNVDIYPTNGQLEVLLGKGTLTPQAGAATGVAASSANLGIGAGQTGAIYRAGGHHVRVAFNSNTGDLPELECDDSGLFSVFTREFTGTVAASEPRKVVTRLHGDLQFNADTTHIVPERPLVNGLSTNEHGHGNNIMFKGDVADLKLMAGMRIKLGDQVRTVATNIDSTSATGDASFYVDEDFVESAVSETKADVFYLFHNFPVEQLYDEATYSSLTISRALHFGGSFTTTLKVDGANTGYGVTPKFTISTALAATKEAGTYYNGVGTADDKTNEVAYMGGTNHLLHDVLPKGTAVSIYGGIASTADGDWHVGTSATTVAQLMPANTESGANYAIVSAFSFANSAIRIYDSMSARSHATTVNEASPPLHNNYRTSWATVTDQRPLIWSTPDIAMTDQSRITGSPSLIANRGVVAGGSNAITFKVDGTIAILTAATTAKTFTLSGSGPPNLLDYLGYAVGATATTQKMFVTISGCSATTAINAEFRVVSITATVMTVLDAESGTNAIPNAVVCAGNTITISSRMGGLIDSKAIAIHDRIKVQRTTSVYETRSVDKVWGSGLDVTMFSTNEGFSSSVEKLQDVTAWIDESGSTENVECSRRGLCDQESGQCACFPGYTSNNCGTQNALAS